MGVTTRAMTKAQGTSDDMAPAASVIEEVAHSTSSKTAGNALNSQPRLTLREKEKEKINVQLAGGTKHLTAKKYLAAKNLTASKAALPSVAPSAVNSSSSASSTATVSTVTPPKTSTMQMQKRKAMEDAEEAETATPVREIKKQKVDHVNDRKRKLVIKEEEEEESFGVKVDDKVEQVRQFKRSRQADTRSKVVVKQEEDEEVIEVVSARPAATSPKRKRVIEDEQEVQVKKQKVAVKIEDDDEEAEVISAPSAGTTVAIRRPSNKGKARAISPDHVNTNPSNIKDEDADIPTIVSEGVREGPKPAKKECFKESFTIFPTGETIEYYESEEIKLLTREEYANATQMEKNKDNIQRFFLESARDMFKGCIDRSKPYWNKEKASGKTPTPRRAIGSTSK